MDLKPRSEIYNLREELLSNPKIKLKCNNLTYAQNLYAALCNMDCQKVDVFEILSNKVCSYSWRTSGGIVAEIRDCGESYMDWYCSGMTVYADGEDAHSSLITKSVSEGTVTLEILQDLAEMGWRPLPDD